MSWFITIIFAWMICLSLNGIATAIDKHAVAIRETAGYTEKCTGPWYSYECEWVKTK